MKSLISNGCTAGFEMEAKNEQPTIHGVEQPRPVAHPGDAGKLRHSVAIRSLNIPRLWQLIIPLMGVSHRVICGKLFTR